MKLISITGFIILSFFECYSQAERTGSLYVSISGGIGASNLLHSEAPHKTHIFYSDISPINISTYELEKFPYTIEYETSLWKNKVLGATINAQIEYFLKENTSIESGLSFEKKGIALEHFKSENKTYEYYEFSHKETFIVRLHNNYLVLPISLKQHLFKSKAFYVGGGLYLGYLLKSTLYYLTDNFDYAYYNDGTYATSFNYFIIDNITDEEKEFTNKFDFGVLIKTGVTKKINERLLFKSDLTCNMGLRKVDAKYKNEYSVMSVPTSSNFSSLLVRSTNYYNLNSYSKNINLLFTIGFAYKINAIK
jgi:hypothetical protein